MIQRSVALLGAGSGDLALIPEMREWKVKKGELRGILFNGNTQDRIISAVNACMKTGEVPASKLIITSPHRYRDENFTVAEAMGKYAERIFTEMEREGHKPPQIIVNGAIGEGGLAKEIRWAYEQARQSAGLEGRIQLEFVMTAAQRLALPLIKNFINIPSHEATLVAAM